MARLCCRRLRLPCTVLASRLAPNEHLPYRILCLPTSPHSANRVFPEAVLVKHTEPDISKGMHWFFWENPQAKEISYKKGRENEKIRVRILRSCAQRGCSAKALAGVEGWARAGRRVYHLGLPYNR